MLVPVTPRPRYRQPLAGSVSVSADTAIVCAAPALASVAAYLAQVLHPNAGGNTGGTGSDGGIELALDPALGEAEGYRLRIDEGGVRIDGCDPAGCFYGVQSLLQSLPAEVLAGGLSAGRDYPLAALELLDAPRYRWRGMHLDCARHFFPVAFIKQYLDLLALHKLNRFHWHLTDDQGWRLESAAYPRLTTIGSWREDTVQGHTSNRERNYRGQGHGGYYSAEDVREVVAYARQRQIEVVPEIDIPGHATALLAAYPEYGCDAACDRDPALAERYRVERHFGIFPDVLCPREATFEFLATIFTEVAALFPGDYVHIGGDEVIKDAWRQCPHCQQLLRDQGLPSVDALHGYFVQRVAAILASLGKQVIGWDEVMDGGVDSSATIMCWNGAGAGVRALEAGHRAIMTPVDTVYFDFYQGTSLDEPQAIHGLTRLRKVYDFEPLPAAQERYREQVLGGQGNVWSEYLPDAAAVSYAALPRMSALAEALWSGSNRDWADFCHRLPGLTQRLAVLGHTTATSVYTPRITVRPIGGQRLELAMHADVPDIAIHYSLDGSTPGPQSPRYAQPLQVDGEVLLRCCGVVADTGACYGDERMQLTAHAGVGKPLYHVVDERLVAAPELAVLSNGCRGSGRIFQLQEWAEFGQQGIDIAMDLGILTSLKGAAFNFDGAQHRRLYHPDSLQLLVSTAGSDWRQVAHCDAAALAAQPMVELEFTSQLARYVRLRVGNSQRHWSPEQRREIHWPLYLDEFVVR